MRPSIHEWHAFTRIWVEHMRALPRSPDCPIWGRDLNYCRLANAMAESDERRHGMDHYLALAVQCKAHRNEMEDARLQRRKEVAETQGWRFDFTGHGWLVETQAITMRERSLTAALHAVETFGQPLRTQWSRQEGGTA